jgi:hypothetical protein
MKEKPFVFESEAALCQAFALWVPEEWVIYPETCSWDILLVHRVGGWQIGVQAKKALNAKVIAQSLAGRARDAEGPDFRLSSSPATPPRCEVSRGLLASQ